MERIRAQGPGLALVLALGLAAPALAQAGQARPFAPLPALSVAEMASLRGGLEVAGLNMDLTAQLRTYIDQRLALATEYRLTRLQEGRQMVQSRLREGRQRLHSGLETALGADAPPTTAPASAATGADHVTDTAPDIRVDTSTRGQIGRGTVTAVTASGVTVVTHTVGPERILSTIANTANGQRIRQEIGIELTVHNFREFSSRVRTALDARRIGRAVSGGF